MLSVQQSVTLLNLHKDVSIALLFYHLAIVQLLVLFSEQRLGQR